MTEPVPFDFRRPGGLADDLDALFSKWTAALCGLAPEKLRDVLSADLQVTANEHMVLPFESAAAQIPDPGVGERIPLSANGPETLLVFSRGMVLTLLGSMMAEPTDGEIVDRELSTVELSLCETLFEGFVAAINEGWPARSVLDGKIDHMILRPARYRMLAPEDAVLVVPFEVAGLGGSWTCHWLLPHKPLEAFLANELRQRKSSSTESRTRLEQRIAAIPQELTVRLGHARLTISQISRLQPGDVVPLDQRTTEPLTAAVGGRTRFWGWPGRSGRNQAFQVATVSEGRVRS